MSLLRTSRGEAPLMQKSLSPLSYHETANTDAFSFINSLPEYPSHWVDQARQVPEEADHHLYKPYDSR
jgi:hypothetical protein